MGTEVAVHWTSTGMFWISVIMAVLTISATSINYLLYRTATDPHVVVYATIDEKRPSVILLIIENIGKGVAKDISFRSSKPIPARAFGWDDAPVPEQMREGPLITGIPSLGPGAKRVITWGQYGGLHKGLGDGAIDLTVRYTGETFVNFRAQEYVTACPLEVSSFATTNAADHNWDRKAVEQLERIARALDKVVGYDGLKVLLTEPDPDEAHLNDARG